MTNHDRPSESVRRFSADQGLILLDTSSNCLWAYNDSARHVWDLIEGGRSGENLAADFAARWGISLEIARRDIEAILHQWRSEGLIGGSRRPSCGEPQAGIETDWTGVPQPQWAATLTCTIRDKVVAFAVEPTRSVAILRILFHHLATPDARPSMRLEVRDAGGGESALLVDGTERFRTRDEGHLIGAVNQAILDHVYPGIEWLAMIHGGAIARNGAAIALPAPSGSGKTTLIAYLLPRGYDYLADDLIALSAPDGRVVPWPLPISIKLGSWELLSETYRDLPSFPQYRTQRGDARQFVPPPQVWTTDPVPMRAFVIPRYVPGAEASLTRITPFEAFERLLSDRIWLGYPMEERKVRDFLAWLDDMPAYVLVHGNVADAARCIEGLL